MSINADGAWANPNFDNLVFEGAVRVTDSEGKTLRTHEAIWSREFAGIYLPAGYSFQNDRRTEETFFVTSLDGILTERSSTPSIEYQDPIDEVEARILAKVSAEAPLLVRAALGMSLDR